MNIRERFFTFSGLILCLFHFSLAQELAPQVQTIDVVQWCKDNSTIILENLRNAILKAEEYWPLDCEILLGKSLSNSIVISFYEYNLDENHELVFRDIEGTELSLKGKGRNWVEGRSFIFRSPLVIHYAANTTFFSKETVKFQFTFTVTHDYLCTKDEFECANRQCIAKRFICDGHNNCGDRSDETGCNNGCTADEFECTNKKCIPKYKLCNSHNDCGDMSDEENCHQNCGILDQYRCSNSRCISNLQVCDDKNDCGDWSDETNCYRPCDYNKFRCNNRKCIDSWLVCNKYDNCGDMSDEKNCRGCLSNEFRCSNRKCIRKDLVCNNRNDCGDFSDEKNCNTAERDSADQRKVMVVELRNPWLITIIVCAAILVIVVVTFAAVVIRNKITKKKKPTTTELSTVPTNTNAQNVQPPNFFGRIRQSFRTGRPSAPSSIQPSGQNQPPPVASGPQTYQVSSTYPQLQSGVENSDVHQVPPTNLLERVRQSFRSGRQYVPSSIQPPDQIQPPPVASGGQTYQVPSMYPQLQTGVDNPEFRAEV